MRCSNCEQRRFELGHFCLTSKRVAMTIFLKPSFFVLPPCSQIRGIPSMKHILPSTISVLTGCSCWVSMPVCKPKEHLHFMPGLSCSFVSNYQGILNLGLNQIFIYTVLMKTWLWSQSSGQNNINKLWVLFCLQEITAHCSLFQDVWKHLLPMVSPPGWT